MNKKLLIIFGVLLLAIVIFIGVSSYRNNNNGTLIADKPIDKSIFETPLEPIPEGITTETCSKYLGNNQYFVCCRENEKLLDCSQRKSFAAGETIELSLNPRKFDIPSTFYVCFSSDLKNFTGEDNLKEPKCFIGNRENTEWLMAGIVPEDKEKFSLIKITSFPDESFNKDQEKLLINLTAGLKK